MVPAALHCSLQKAPDLTPVQVASLESPYTTLAKPLINLALSYSRAVMDIASGNQEINAGKLRKASCSLLLLSLLILRSLSEQAAGAANIANILAEFKALSGRFGAQMEGISCSWNWLQLVSWHRGQTPVSLKWP